MRDRHQRGLRAPLAPANCLAGQVIRIQRPTLATPFFVQCVSQAVQAIEEAVPDALAHIDIGVDDVPDLTTLWSAHMPLASAVEADDSHLTQIVVYRRPIEFRAGDRTQQRQLVFLALVEQVASVTGLSVASLDPHNLRGED